MQDRELYQELLGLGAPWAVSEVELRLEEQEILVRVEHPRGTKFLCPECSAAGCERELACYDHAEERRWRHLDSCQCRTILVACVPRVRCPEHGVRTVSVPWAEGSSRFTILFERLAIDVLTATQTVTGAMQILRLKWDQTWHIIERAVQRGQARKVERPLPRVGIDVGLAVADVEQGGPIADQPRECQFVGERVVAEGAVVVPHPPLEGGETHESGVVRQLPGERLERTLRHERAAARRGQARLGGP